jgi:hypothetical protein
MSTGNGFRQSAAASFRRGAVAVGGFARKATVVSEGIDVAKTVVDQGSEWVKQNVDNESLAEAISSPLTEASRSLDFGRAATAVPGDILKISEAVGKARGQGWKAQAASGAAASSSLLKDLGTVVGRSSVVAGAFGLAPAVPLMVAGAGLSIAGAGVAVWAARRAQSDGAGGRTSPDGSGGGSSGTGSLGAGVLGAAVAGTAGGSMVQQLRENLRGLNQQLEILETGLDQQREELRQRGQQLQQLIGGSRAEQKALERLAASMNSLRVSSRAVEEARKAMAKLQL